MSKKGSKRRRIQDLYDAGMAQSEIAQIVDVNVHTVRRIRNAKTTGRGIERIPDSRGQNKKREEGFLDSLKTTISFDPTNSMRRLSYELNVDPKIARTAVKDDPGMKQ